MEMQTEKPQKKPNLKIIIIVIIIAAIVIIAAVVLLFKGEGSGGIVGTWKVQSGFGEYYQQGSTMIFESNGDLKAGNIQTSITVPVGTWNVQGTQICFQLISSVNFCLNYAFSNGGNTLTLTDPTGDAMWNNLVLTK